MRAVDKPALLKELADATKGGPGGDAGSRRRAFDLAHRVFRLMELAAETASRERWSMLTGPGRFAGTRHEFYAARVASSAINYPVHGEAAVYAALLDAVDLAHALSEQLYAEWLKTQRKCAPAPLPEPGVNKIGAPLAPGCTRRECCAGSDELSASDGPDG